MFLELKEVDKKKVGFFRFKQLDGKYLITNDAGEYSLLSEPEFDLFLCGNISQINPEKENELKDKHFLRDQLNLNDLAARYASRNTFLGQGTSLHIVVVTLRCDNKCIYCQAGSGSKGLSAKGLDMDIPTAGKVVDKIFESPSKCITIEFQGGEPLLNWDAIEFIVEYAQKKNKSAKKDLLISLVSNFSFMTKDRLKFLMEHKVALCTSLDGPEILHNKNRITKGKRNSYRNTIKWLKLINKEIRRNKKYKYKVNALTTITKQSLSCPKRIIDEYVKLGLEQIFLRPVNPFGLNKKMWQRVGLKAEEFINFYKQALDYILELNKKGRKFSERAAGIFLTKIMGEEDPNYMEIRSPCGAGIGQLAYNFNGDIYTCDEGRMLSVIGDDSFRLGNVHKNTYEELMNSEVAKTMCLASCLDNLADCNECVYKPYCGVCPIYNYVSQGNIFSTAPFNDRCKVNMAILDYIVFVKLQDSQSRDILHGWVKKRENNLVRARRGR